MNGNSVCFWSVNQIGGRTPFHDGLQRNGSVFLPFGWLAHEPLELLKGHFAVAAQWELLAPNGKEPLPLLSHGLGDMGMDQPFSFSSDEAPKSKPKGLFAAPGSWNYLRAAAFCQNRYYRANRCFLKAWNRRKSLQYKERTSTRRRTSLQSYISMHTPLPPCESGKDGGCALILLDPERCTNTRCDLQIPSTGALASSFSVASLLAKPASGPVAFGRLRFFTQQDVETEPFTRR